MEHPILKDIMKRPFSLLILLATAILTNAEEKPVRYGFLNVVNVIPGKVSCEIELAGKELVPGGLKASSETGWFMLPTGKHAITIARAGHLRKKADIEMTEGTSKLIVIHAEPAADVELPAIGFTTLPAYPSKGFGLKFMSTCATGGTFQIAKKKFEAERFEIVTIPDWSGGGFQLQHLSKLAGTIARGRDRASYYVLVADDAAGSYLVTIVNADLQQLPPWMEQQAQESADTPEAD